MKFKHVNISIVAVMFATIAMQSCNRSSNKTGNGSLLSLDTTEKSAISDGGDPKKLCAYLKDNDYFPSNSYAENTKVLFSSSYHVVENSAGQGYGVIGADGFFEQKGNTTQQLLLCPGASNLSGGKCAWKINGDDGYAQLAYDVVCNKRARGGSSIHPGYSKQSAKVVSYVAKTAGKTMNGVDAVEVILEGRESKARIVFGKGVGLVATVFQESSTPSGTAEVFIGGASSSND